MTHVNFTTSGVALTDTQVARIREEIENTRFRSAWDNGVKLYALDIQRRLLQNAGLREGNRGLYAAIYRNYFAAGC